MIRYLLPNILKAAAIAWIIWLGWGWWALREIPRAPGVLAAEEPIQKTAAPHERTMGDYTLTLRDRFDITARVLSRKNYEGKENGDLVPVDLALGWGAMSDSTYLDKMRIAQGTRTYGWVLENISDVPDAVYKAIPRSSANMHIIPANDAVRKILVGVRKGDIVRITGNLTDFNGPHGAQLSSTTRGDVGFGACEIIYAEQIVIQPRP